MKRAIETRPGPKRLAYLALTLTILAGCEEALGTAETAEKSQDNDGKIELIPQVTSGSQRDVEAPDVFRVTEAGLWDGRPSLGGIWVAHPDVNQPERVVIKNTANNKSVTGALFRRERNLPGPALQVSSAAAEQLGLLAGSPTKLSVVALRREKIEEPTAEESPQAEDVTAENETASADTAADGQATGDPEKLAKRKWWQKKEPAVAAAGTAAVVASASESEEDTTAETETVSDSAQETAEEQTEAPAEKPAKRKWWQKKAPAAAAAGTAAAATDAATDSAEVATEAAAAVTSPALSDAPVEAPAEKPAKRKWWQKKDPAEITETPLDPIEGAAAAIDATEATPAAATAAAAATTASPLSKPFVQIGTFSVEDNANSAAQKVRRNGMSAVVRELKTANNTVWRVLVGPAATRAERKAIQKDVKDLGFKDAFTVSD
ncbi:MULTISPECIES: SPOR domain-containing protein [unclassified Ruegeria]|uniref:SPOR domain-containing protein n=1 Tax=unclassified Ruegeria TaxID=2625375 RepID=UPI001490A820|nr:SPOR domain-containing protein [Ruegeria sp. HKCCD4318]NOE12366.1 SPOR domain-containing protein [Ruegeria sp. HKCCD4318-2]NOG09469.1 SPOR domain-containing protein [Ruegeria sp. HKCCD4315]